MFLYLFNVTEFVVVLRMTVVAVFTSSVLFAIVSVFYLVLLSVFEEDPWIVESLYHTFFDWLL